MLVPDTVPEPVDNVEFPASYKYNYFTIGRIICYCMDPILSEIQIQQENYFLLVPDTVVHCCSTIRVSTIIINYNYFIIKRHSIYGPVIPEDSNTTSEPKLILVPDTVPTTAVP